MPELLDDDEVIICDNGVAPKLPFKTTLIQFGRNRGFAHASNMGLRSARTDAVLFLNNDIMFTHRGWLQAFREALEPGVLVGKLRSGAHTYVDSHELPYLDGWCLAGMREDLLALGGFDETLAEPAYFSDNLLCLEARAAGMTLREVRVGLVHKENSTAGPAWDERVRAATNTNKVRYEARARELLIAA